MSIRVSAGQVGDREGSSGAREGELSTAETTDRQRERRGQERPLSEGGGGALDFLLDRRVEPAVEVA